MEKAVAPWKQLLLTALESNSSTTKNSAAFIQLATLGPDGRPANRTVVFRGFQEMTEKIQINTDCRSRKIDDLKHCPYAEICWYFTESWEQFRINGRVDVIDGSCSDLMKLQQREKAWFASSLRSRLQYLGPHPGLPSLTEQDPPPSIIDAGGGPVDSFCQLVLEPDKVDYLNLKIGKRVHFTSEVTINGDKHWTSDNINP
ncbi:pyridoxine/pyridoxamine 5'-phosphate oxidase 2 [Impatiens glandulifera]|uniref:pyridoxine/pyridoxamine 5'-phosphate oxidase 2 n=1 Tax=Impatiens glandulifera TaxID=253017 RepID=UPI001FB15A40|nr:pyridoxine/pyridoxamine 5'-phosphate oxidase 2 [Impatiens glandulifera]